MHVGDLLEPATLPAALRGVDAAYHLVHSMYAGRDFAARDLRRRAVELALERTGEREVPTRWSSSLTGEEPRYRVTDWEGAIREVRTARPGLRRGRRHPDELLPGEAVDFWRVEAVEPPRLLRLRAEMRVPGAAWLEWTVHPDGEGSVLVQTATFAPRGLAGALYWYGLYPVHRCIFSDMARAVARRAEAAPGAP